MNDEKLILTLSVIEGEPSEELWYQLEEEFREAMFEIVEVHNVRVRMTGEIKNA
jgi:hypothetical protein